MSSFNYTTKQGDRWDTVSYAMYGSLAFMDRLIQANPAVPLDPVFPDGTVLVIPIVDDTTSALITTNLPPWKS
jgi:phage tail protein X